MTKNDFLKSIVVKEFVDWIEGNLDDSFYHSYCMKKPHRAWECNSVYSAFENYYWPFSYKDPHNGDKISGVSFDDSLSSLSKLSNGLKRSIEDSDHECCRNHCFSILDWGGVLSKNGNRINELGENICGYLSNVKSRFSGDLASGDYYDNEIIMNSGFTKIYSLYIDDFIIYDGRVGAALGLLVSKYCEDASLNHVPKELSFAWGKGKESTYIRSSENKRNPGNEKYVFPELLNNPKRHTENNIRANWLLREIINKTASKFNNLPAEVQIRALEAALFMIGYQVVS